MNRKKDIYDSLLGDDKDVHINSLINRIISLENIISNIKCDKMCNFCKRLCPTTKRCSGCRSVYYCKRKCQEKDWKGHKKYCVSIQNNVTRNNDDSDDDLPEIL